MSEDLVERFSNVMRASHTIRSEVSLTISESRDLRVAARQARMEAFRIRELSAANKKRSLPRRAERPLQVAYSLAEVLAASGYFAFVAEPSTDSASFQ